MTLRKFILATTILTAATGYAFAQSGPAPANTLDSNTKASPPTAPTDNSAASASGNDHTMHIRLLHFQYLASYAPFHVQGVPEGSLQSELQSHYSQT
jgi:hypothetical protein